MSGYRAKIAKCRLATLLAMSWIFILAAAAGAEVINFQELLPLVDIKIPAWNMEGKPSGATLKQGQVIVSEARVSFRAGDQTLEITVMDFLGKSIPFLNGQHLEMESSEETVRTTEVKGFKAMETFRHQDRQGELNISVADRFWVKIDGDGIDNLEVLRKVAQQMDLKKLAALAK